MVGRNGEGDGALSKAANAAADPAHADDAAQPSPSQTGDSPEGISQSRAPSKTSSRRNSVQIATSEPRHPSPAANGDRSSAEPASQPPQPPATTTPASTSSHASAKESKDATPAMEGYGTRSRNRPRASRVNYADDLEDIDEFENAGGAAINGNTSEASSRGSLATDSATIAPASGSRKGTGKVSNNAAAAKNDQQLGPNVAGAPSKRRKNAASHATNGHHASGSAPRANATPGAISERESNMLTFEKTRGMLINGRLESDDGQTVSIDDQVYLVCEPPGEPYYLCRVMEYIHVNGDPSARVEALRVNWFYRPRDVQRFTNDTRLVYATMHSDICPITSLRGRCTILHRSEIDDLDDYRKKQNSFWFNQVFDRFIHRWYDVIPTSQVINVPDKVKKALDDRWKYICLETSRVKELTSAVKTCKRCVGYCATVECAVCHNTYHMNCVRPPLLKKPSRGFAWACGPCSRAQEKKLEARRTPIVGSGNEDGDEEEMLDEEEEDVGETTAPSPNDSENELDLHPGTQAEIALAKMWPMRYLGIHCRVEDALQYDDRAIYPRASSRLGPRHQANVNVWHGRPVELVKPAEIKRRYVKAAGHKKDTKLSKETVAALEADKAEKAKRPKWVMDEPPGYVRRGEDYPNKDSKCTAELMFKMPPLGVHSTRGEEDSPTVTEEQVEEYMGRAKGLAKAVGVETWNTNFLDKCLSLFTKCQYDAEAALKQVKKLDRRKDLREPELSKDEEKRWNEGVAKYGSEIRNVRLHVNSKNITYGDAVRYYYMWKKTPKGREIWGSYSNRKGRNKKVEADSQTRLLDDIADDHDDSAFDNEKALQRKRGFQCKFCSTRHSRVWRRAPGVSPGQTVAADGRASKNNSVGFVLSLCQRCANLWRKYAVKWENTDEIAKKVAQGGGKAWKRRIDEELLREVYAATSEANTANGTPEYADLPAAAAQVVVEPPKKKQKIGTTTGTDSGTSTPANEPIAKKKEKEKPPPAPRAPTPPIIPAPPRLRVLPCAVCRQVDGPRLECTACRLTVHKTCYGIDEVRHAKWFCDTCKNDKKESVSYVSDQDLFEPPKVSHKKKTDREREKERLEKELVDKAREEWRQKQQDKGRPYIPREPLKRTADNNWVHVYCALWIPETKFTSPNRLDMVEGIGAPTLRYDVVCKLCKTGQGACVACPQCHSHFHVGCAHNAGYIFGFNVNPVKATRRDAVPIVTINGESGTMIAEIWCKDHPPKTVLHSMHEEVEGSDLVALQLFAREFKQADLTLTGTARKANLVDQSTRSVPQTSSLTQNGRRTSAVTTQTPTSAKGRQSNAGLSIKQEEPLESQGAAKPERSCVKCKVDASPRWWKLEDFDASVPSNRLREPEKLLTTNGAISLSRSEQFASHEGTLPLNGSVDRIASDGQPSGGTEPSSQLRIDTNLPTARSAAYLCQKCHWKKHNTLEDSPEREISPSVIPDSQQLPVRSPPMQPYVAPTPSASALAGPWVPTAPNLPPPPSQQQAPPPLPAWHSNGIAAPGPPPLHNGIPHPAPPGPSPLGHPVPFHSPYNPLHQHNGYPPYTGSAGHPPLPPAPLRVPYPAPPVTAPPPPLHLNNGPIINGIHSPRMPFSPTHPHGHVPSRSTESPFNTPAPLAQYPPSLHHSSPAPGQLNNRPETPRDTLMRDAPPITAPPPPEPPRATTGASASPSLRNLLH